MLSLPTHKKGKREARLQGGNSRKQTQTKSKNKTIRVYKNSEEGFVHLKKNTMMKKNVMTIVAAPTSCTQREERGE